MNKLLSVLVAGALAAGVVPLASAAEEGGTLDRAKGAVKRQVDKAKEFHQRNVARGTTGAANPQVGERPAYPGTATSTGAGSAAAGTGAGAMGGMGSGDMAGRNDSYAADRERTRERAQRWAQERNR